MHRPDSGNDGIESVSEGKLSKSNEDYFQNRYLLTVKNNGFVLQMPTEQTERRTKRRQMRYKSDFQKDYQHESIPSSSNNVVPTRRK
jgi:hypothetical protein